MGRAHENVLKIEKAREAGFASLEHVRLWEDLQSQNQALSTQTFHAHMILAKPRKNSKYDGRTFPMPAIPSFIDYLHGLSVYLEGLISQKAESAVLECRCFVYALINGDVVTVQQTRSRR
jgi:hypothetical protein